ncbi:MAG: carboxylesterase [Legionellales bacterium]|nr:carboxylesterase [Legionellales bacterium]|tara:strand:- start:138976 stop:139653 length:678 start_codon:yes stop_codon:yes gene_type:complete
MTTEPLQTIVIEPASEATHAIIWLHGLGASGHDFEPIVPELRLPEPIALRFIFPHAPIKPVTINGGIPMPAWYDIKDISIEAREDAEGIQQSAQAIIELIKQQNADGIASHNIFLAGFSQGGALALHTGLRYSESLAGILALSCYLPLARELDTQAAQANRQTPIMMAHGIDDPVVPYQFGEASKNHLQTMGYNIDWCTYPMDHSVCGEEIIAIGRWLTSCISPT